MNEHTKMKEGKVVKFLIGDIYSHFPLLLWVSIGLCVHLWHDGEYALVIIIMVMIVISLIKEAVK